MYVCDCVCVCDYVCMCVTVCVWGGGGGGGGGMSEIRVCTFLSVPPVMIWHSSGR